MKSIKEKSEEHAPYTREDSWDKTQRCIIAQTSFEAGANYVLEQVDYILMDRDLDCEETCDSLFALIEQLKK